MLLLVGAMQQSINLQVSEFLRSEIKEIQKNINSNLNTYMILSLYYFSQIYPFLDEIVAPSWKPHLLCGISFRDAYLWRAPLPFQETGITCQPHNWVNKSSSRDISPLSCVECRNTHGEAKHAATSEASWKYTSSTEYFYTIIYVFQEHNVLCCT